MKGEVEEKKVEIVNPWCILRGIMYFPVDIGRIERDEGDTIGIRFSESQLYGPQIWDSRYFERFATFEELVNKLAEYQRVPYQFALELCLADFPSQRPPKLTLIQGERV